MIQRKILIENPIKYRKGYSESDAKRLKYDGVLLKEMGFDETRMLEVGTRGYDGEKTIISIVEFTSPEKKNLYLEKKAKVDKKDEELKSMINWLGFLQTDLIEKKAEYEKRTFFDLDNTEVKEKIREVYTNIFQAEISIEEFTVELNDLQEELNNF